MGTNYYYIRSKCEHCGRGEEERLHIGKSSSGWAFLLHIDDERRSLSDWLRLWETGGGRIVDEYGDEKTIAEVLNTITNRTHLNGLSRLSTEYPEQAKPGPGTWDLCPGEFS